MKTNCSNQKKELYGLLEVVMQHINMGVDVAVMDKPQDQTKFISRSMCDPVPQKKANHTHPKLTTNIQQPQTPPTQTVAATRPTQQVPTQQVTHTPNNTPLTNIPSSNTNTIHKSSRERANECLNLPDLLNNINKISLPQLRNNATNTVVYDGDTNADIMLIGEGPGANEDQQGKPFVGDSGMLLNKMLQAIGIKREEVYITNTVFWRPPGNRRPTPQEIETCLPFVEKQIQLVNPKIIILLGSTAMSAILQLSQSLTQARATTHQYTNQYTQKPITTMITYHPSYLLRQSTQKELAWNDMLKLKQIYQDKSTQE